LGDAAVTVKAVAATKAVTISARTTAPRRMRFIEFNVRSVADAIVPPAKS
jgi:hypothetical protein